MKRPSKSKRQQQKERKSLPTELSSFSLAAAISEASASTPPSPSQNQKPQTPRKIFNIESQQSLATNASFTTANDQANENSTTAAASYFVDSSDEDTNEGLNFGNDPLILAVLSQTATTNTNSSNTTPTEISFASNASNNPEETMPSKKSTERKIAPIVEATPTPPTTSAPAKKDPTPIYAPVTVVKAASTAPEAPATKDKEEAHFDLAQNVYTTVKDIWSWGKSVPVITSILGLTEVVATKVLNTTVHMDLLALDSKVATPQLKKLDDDIVSPIILAVWKIIEPAVHKSDEMVIQPVMKEVVPRVLAPFGMFDQKKKDWERKKEEERKSAMIDTSCTPEVVPMMN